MKTSIFNFFISFLSASIMAMGCIGSHVSKDIYLFDSATVVRSTDYKILGKGKGQDSAFYLLGMFPVTKAPNVELAMSQILEKYPTGKTLINIKIQREDKAYFPLGLVTVVNVTADVVGQQEETENPNAKGNK
ncbi:hypothetical protein [Leptospira meyeri]|uniref:Lipoprotein n=1 Tax=Leptospira meyeri TaxID=29508 RepID=A0A4R8N1B8_LEPME|nr:hypothetical protein [Leptospira meyeri]MCW7487960.1 hypothetical protein [Leptospira meyeri]TDY73662.1 hypothetical protein CLV96_2698 [Leptospira meyeri]TGL15563.1 hypothetical protein EHQ50_06450 [Leptospira meyeri]TGM19961.1 hypothetical protein EHQ73_17005 [Leptospira meyeri]TGM63645.1 hypothetical protein EHQ94_13425 [Leptospira meyeri]